MSKELSAKYNPADVEDKWYAYWQEHKLFASSPDNRKPYTVIMPPPNVTGILHMGHMLNNTIQDILVRRARMTGYNACWVPGTDHASIATEAKVVERLAKQGIKKSDLSREEFLKHVWDWTHEHGGIIIDQLKKVGASCDWDRLAFTMDDERSEGVIDVFCDLYRKGLIYRGVRMINWDPKAQTAISDEEVLHEEQKGKLYYIRYYVEGEENKYIVVATTRPETIFGDTAVCIHPEDQRYQWLKGKRVIVPGVGRSVPIILDEYVDLEFGTGCLKVTPCHDINDYMLGQKHNLPEIDIFNDNGTLNSYGGKYEGHDRMEVRNTFVQELDSLGLIEKIEDYVNKVGLSERTHVPIEPKLSMQWFLKMTDLAKPAYKAVMDDVIKLVPDRFKGIYAHWMENIKDWNISRQLYWGHRIPAYFLEDGTIVVGENIEIALEEAKKQTGNPELTKDDLRQDPDTLDTWFSSWLWPISVFGNPMDKDNKDLNYYYPTADLVSGPDILFFWIARMIIAGYEFRGEIPFKNVYLTGIVRDMQRRKMSKSLGNSPDPLKLIAQYGADGVRMGLMTAASAGNDILFDETLVEQGRNFNNKVWNSFRLIQGWEVSELAQQDAAQVAAVNWFEQLLRHASAELQDLFSKYRISDAILLLYKLIRDDFSGTYLELIKPAYGEPIDPLTLKSTNNFFERLLKLLHPFMPFITEELWQALEPRKDGESIMVAQLEEIQPADISIIKEMEVANAVITQIRNLRAQRNVSPREELELYNSGEELSPSVKAVVGKLANITAFHAGKIEESAEVATFMVGTGSFGVPFTGLIDIDAELKKLNAEVEHLEKFLKGVRGKLSNEKFVSNAPEQVVALERKKESDALEKLESVRTRIASLQK
ncbi:valine--tRNA ligase [Porphyromonadaceae bacterium W3.11]|nr:valine--tRNA ligase [Porphyromonadaceae bacterium W3.11]